MQNFIVTLLMCSVTMSALVLIYMAITPLLEKRYSAKGRYYTWLIIVIGLIIPFRPYFSNAFVKVDIPDETVLSVIQMGDGAPINMPFENNMFSTTIPNISLWQVLAIAWLVGVIVFLAYHTIKHYRFVKLVIRWSENITDEGMLTLFQNLKAEIDITNRIELKLCVSIGSPTMIGFIRPMILLPKLDFAKDELGFILQHELVHYKRKDLWYKCLVLAATAIHWFNPIVYRVVL